MSDRPSHADAGTSSDEDLSDENLITEGSGNVFLDLGFSEEEAARLQLRSDLMHLLAGHIEESGMTQQEAARLFGVTQPRVSDLVNQQAEKFSLDALMGMAVKAGARIGISIEGLRGSAAPAA